MCISGSQFPIVQCPLHSSLPWSFMQRDMFARFRPDPTFWWTLYISHQSKQTTNCALELHNKMDKVYGVGNIKFMSSTELYIPKLKLLKLKKNII